MSMATPPVTIFRHEPPDPTNIDPRAGWCGVVAAVIAGPVVGEVWQYVDTDGEITYDGEVKVEQHGDTGTLVKLRDARAWSALATVSGVVADTLEGLTDATTRR